MNHRELKAHVCLAAGGAALLLSSLAHASNEQHVVVLGVGTNGEAIATGVESHLGLPYSSVDAGPFRSALGASVHLLPLAARRHDKDAAFVARARAAERSTHADSAIVVYAEKSKKAVVLHVWVIGAQGTGTSVDVDVRLAAGASAGDGADAVWSAVAAEFPAAEPAPTPAPTTSAGPATAPPAAAAPAEGEPAKAADQSPGAPVSADEHPRSLTRGTSIGRLELAMGAGTRHFSYVDRLTPSLRPYDLSVAPLLAIQGEVFPFAGTHLPVLSGLGATGSYARAVGLSSKDATGNKVGTSWQAFDLGLRERILLGDSFILAVDLAYGNNAFSFDTPVTATAQLPSAQYSFARGGIDGRVVLGALSAHAGASYLGVFSTGDFGRLFPRTSVGGVEAAVGLSYRITPRIELSLDAAYTRFFYNLLPEPGDPYVAGGALDQMGTLSLGVGYLF